MKPTQVPAPRRVPVLIVVAVVLVGVVMICSPVPALNFWGVVLVVVSPILWGLEYMPAETPAAAEEVSRG